MLIEKAAMGILNKYASLWFCVGKTDSITVE